MSLLAELRRRKVFRVAAAYAVAAWALAQVADLVLENTAAPPWVMQTILLLLALGFPLAVILAWAFEVTPDGVKRTESAATPAGAPPLGGQDRILIVLLLAVIVIAGYQLAKMPGSKQAAPSASASVESSAAQERAPNTGAGSTNEERTTIAVLPFRAMSSGDDDEYFADGLTEEILNSLAQLPELLVTARTSSFHFKDQDLPVPQIAETLGVGHVLEGSVRRGGEQVRITAQLIRADDGFHLWSNTYDRTLEDVFAVQEDIATNVADALDVVLDDEKLSRMRRSGTDDLDAFIAFQKGRELFVAAHEDIGDIERRLRRATPLFEQALQASPGYTAAVIYKADALAHVIYDIASGIREPQFPNEAEDALRSLRSELDSAWELARPGHQRDILDVERTVFRDDWTGLDAKLDRAMRPGDCPLSNWTHEFATALGDPVSVLEASAENLRCDPLNALAIFHHAFAHIWADQPEEAIRITRQAIDQGIRYVWIEGLEYWARLATGDLDHPAVRDATGQAGWWLIPAPLVTAAAAGDRATAQRLAEALWADDSTDDQSALGVAAMIGDRERANELAARIDARPGGAIVLNNAIYSCLCGVPFDLEETPDFARRIEQAGVPWPPKTVIDFPAKDW